MRWLLPFALCCCGCFLRAQGGYSTSIPASGAGGGKLFLRYGLPVVPEARLFLLLNVGFGNSIGPTS